MQLIRDAETLVAPLPETGVSELLRPHDIPIDRHYFDSFGHHLTETSANWVIQFCRDRDRNWTPFTLDEINAYYDTQGLRDFRFNRLVSDRVIDETGGVFYLTHEFVQICHRSALRSKR